MKRHRKKPFFDKIRIGGASLFAIPITILLFVWAFISLLPRMLIKSMVPKKGDPKISDEQEDTGFTQDFDEVLKKEKDFIKKRRSTNKVEENTPESPLGISISGGGIRSATLGLGAFQKLMKEDLMRYFDYMSTVSGGGYIGSCLTSLLSEENPAATDSDHPNYYLEKIGLQAHNSPFLGLNNHLLSDNAKHMEHGSILTGKDQLHHLRTHGEYLTPDKNPFSRDVRRAFGAIWTGIVYNLAVFITLVLGGVALVYSLVYLLSEGHFFYDISYPSTEVISDGTDWNYITVVLSNWFENGFKMHLSQVFGAIQDDPIFCYYALGIGFFVSITFFFNIYISRVKADTVEEIEEVASGETLEFRHDMKWINRFMYTSIVMGLILPYVLVIIINGTDLSLAGKDVVDYWLAFGISIFYGIGLALGTFSYLPIMEYTKYFILPFIGGWSKYKTEKGMNLDGMRGKAFRVASFVKNKMYLRDFRSLYRSFQGQAGYFLLISLIIPILLATIFSIYFSWKFILTLFSLGVVTYAINGRFGTGTSFVNKIIFAIKTPLINLAVLVVILLAFNGLARFIMAYNSDIGNYETYHLEYDVEKGFNFLEDVESFSNPLTIQYSDQEKIEIVLPKGEHKDEARYIKQNESGLEVQDYNRSDQVLKIRPNLAELQTSDTLKLFIFHPPSSHSKISFGNFHVDATSPYLLLFTLLSVFVMGSLANANKISLHYFYRDRLSEAYLRTEGRVERKNPMHKQGYPLRVLRNHDTLFLNKSNTSYKGPYHLIVTALNLQGSNDLVRKVNKSEHFVFSKDFVGSSSTGYVSTDVYRKGKTTLAIAMTISAAAIASGMGRMSFAAQNFFMTLFNLRTGYWIENPWRYRTRKEQLRMNQRWKFLNRTFWIEYLFDEMSGNTNARNRRVNVSDGGFTGDNLGLVPLLQRKCGIILVCDFEEDGKFHFESFDNATRIANVDYNIKVDINLQDLVPTMEKDGISQCKHSVAVGDIIYHNEQKKGTLIYLKSSVSEFKGKDIRSKIPVTVFSYAKGNPKFPHEPTADQYFNDAQFEAYRALGYHITAQAIDAIKTAIQRNQPS